MKRLAVVMGLVVIGGCRFDYFDDPAVKACRASIIETLRSPKTYDEIEAKFYTSIPSSDVFITYEAANAYGTQIRDIEQCKFIKFDNDWYYIFGSSDDDNSRIKFNSMRFISALAGDYYRISASKTKLQQDFPSKAESLCLKEALKEYGEWTRSIGNKDNEKNMPPTYIFSIDHGNVINETIDVLIKSLETDIRKLPKTYYCSIAVDGDGVKNVISGIR